MNWTEEQKPVMSSLARLIRIIAFAGTGKTTTLVGYAKAHPAERILYICYNKSVELEARTRFPANVTAKTAHGLAYGAVGAQYNKKLTGNLRLTDIARLANTSNWDLVKDILGTLNNFVASDDAEMSEDHFPRLKDKAAHTSRHRQHIDNAMGAARRIWGRMIDLDDTEASISHDGYLKVFSLRKPNLSLKFDTITIDESQDINPVIGGIVRLQVGYGSKVIAVGDPHQQLYAFRGAEDALAAPWLEKAETHFLTESFRFGPAAADVANILLALKGETQTLKGKGQKTQIKTKLPAGLPHAAFLHRTVAGVIETALALLPTGKLCYWVGGINSYNLSDLEDLYYFRQRDFNAIKNHRLTRDFENYDQYRDVADQSEDMEMMRLYKMVESHGDALPDLLDQLRRSSTSDELSAGYTLSTVHKSKGLQWDSVAICEDFSYDPLDTQNKDPQRQEDEINILYVAATRAMKHLAVNSVILSIMQAHVLTHGSLKQSA